MNDDLVDFFTTVNQAKKLQKEELDSLISNSFEEFFLNPLKEEVKQKKKKKLKILKEETTIVEKSLGLLSEPSEIKQQKDPITPIEQNFVTLEQLNQHYNTFISRIQQQLSTLGGGGETRFEFLDDVNRISVKRDGYFLKFDSTTSKFLGSAILDDDYTIQISNQGEDIVISVINVPNSDLGPIQSILFDPDHTTIEDYVGLLTWNKADRTLNIKHPDGVTQQVGQETYFLVKNETGVTINNGSLVRFSGATNGVGEARLLVSPFLADGTYPSLYTVGVLTQDIENGKEGLVTVFGKIRDLNTTGALAGETWTLGDILYAHPTIPGGLTKVKPTAPNNVIPIAAVVKVNSTSGEIFVRPTIEQKYSYGRFAKTTSFTFDQVDTEYKISLNQTEISNGVGIGTTVSSRIIVDQSGFYKINASAQLDTSGTKGICYMWIKKNESNVVGSTRRTFITATEGVMPFNYTIDISLNANDYIELCTASSSDNLRFNAFAATAFAPSTAAVSVSIIQEVL